MRKFTAGLMAALMSFSMIVTAPVKTEAAEEKEIAVDVVDEIAVSANVSVKATAVNKFEWEGNQIKKYIGSDAAVVIPAKATGIMTNAFRGSTITSVDFSQSSVAFIGNNAFENCKSLKKVVLNAVITDIGVEAFKNCSALTACNFAGASSLVKIQNSAFYNTGLSKVTLPSKVNSLGAYAFNNCSRLKTFKFNKLLMNNGVISPSYSTFENCPLLVTAGTETTDNFIFPTGTQYIPQNLFYRCNSLTTVKLPAATTSIETYAFSYCSNLKKIVLNNKLTNIGSYAFYGSTKLNACNFKEATALTTIGMNAFTNTSLKIMRFPVNLKSIGEHAFTNCKSLTKVEINKTFMNSGSVTGSGAIFYGCTGLVTMGPGTSCSVVLPAGTTRIPDYAFAWMGGLTKVTLPETVTEVGKYAFQNCRALAKVVLNGRLRTIQSYAFYSCQQLSTVNFREAYSLQTIDTYAFNDCNLKIMRLGDELSTIGSGAFKGNKYLNNVYFYNEYFTQSLYGWRSIFNCNTTIFHTFRGSENALSLQEVPEYTGRIKYMSR